MVTVQLHDYCIPICFHLILIVNYYKAYNIGQHALLLIIDWSVSGITIVKDLSWLNVCQRRNYFTDSL